MTQFAAAAVRQVVFHCLADAMQTAPDEVRQPCAVPQAADKEGQNQVAVLFCGAAPATPQRDIDVIPQPLGQADMPPRPDILDGIRKEGLAEVFGQLQPQHLAEAKDNVRVAGEVRVELHGEQHTTQQKLGAVKGGGVGEHGVHHHGSAIRHRKLFKVAPRAALRAAPRPGGIPFCGAVQLGHELVVAVERSLGNRQKERRIAQKPQVFFFRQHASPAHIAEVARQLQGEVPKPQRPRQGTLPAQGGGQVLEQGQRQQRGGQPRVKDAFFRRATGAPPNQKRACQQHRQRPPGEHGVKYQAGPQHQLPAARRRADKPKPRQHRCKQHKTG